MPVCSTPPRKQASDRPRSPGNRATVKSLTEGGLGLGEDFGYRDGLQLGKGGHRGRGALEGAEGFVEPGDIVPGTVLEASAGLSAHDGEAPLLVEAQAGLVGYGDEAVGRACSASRSNSARNRTLPQPRPVQAGAK